MHRIKPKLATLALLSAATAALPACSKKSAEPSENPVHTMVKGGDESITRVQSPDGGSIASTIKATATVTAVDPATRRVKLRMSDGSQTTVKCGAEVVNFEQIKVNDKVNVTMVEELAIHLKRADGPADGQSAGVMLAPEGAKPSAAVAGTVQVTGKITAIDTNTRRVTLKLPDGSSERVRAGEQIDLSAVKPGDDVTVRYSEALAVSVETP
jgi:hypothetical protein